MALTPCPECGRQISDNAIACPGCGHPGLVQVRTGRTVFGGYGALKPPEMPGSTVELSETVLPPEAPRTLGPRTPVQRDEVPGCPAAIQAPAGVLPAARGPVGRARSLVGHTAKEGIGRLTFLLGLVALFLLARQLAELPYVSESSSRIVALTVADSLLRVVLCWLRVKNIGRNPFWSLFAPIPVVCLVVILPCLYMPPGYGYKGRLNLTTKNVIGFTLAVALLTAILLIRS